MVWEARRGPESPIGGSGATVPDPTSERKVSHEPSQSTPKRPDAPPKSGAFRTIGEVATAIGLSRANEAGSDHPPSAELTGARRYGSRR